MKNKFVTMAMIGFILIVFGFITGIILLMVDQSSCTKEKVETKCYDKFGSVIEGQTCYNMQCKIVPEEKTHIFSYIIGLSILIGFLLLMTAFIGNTIKECRAR